MQPAGFVIHIPQRGGECSLSVRPQQVYGVEGDVRVFVRGHRLSSDELHATAAFVMGCLGSAIPLHNRFVCSAKEFVGMDFPDGDWIVNVCGSHWLYVRARATSLLIWTQSQWLTSERHLCISASGPGVKPEGLELWLHGPVLGNMGSARSEERRAKR